MMDTSSPRRTLRRRLPMLAVFLPISQGFVPAGVPLDSGLCSAATGARQRRPASTRCRVSGGRCTLRYQTARCSVVDPDDDDLEEKTDSVDIYAQLRKRFEERRAAGRQTDDSTRPTRKEEQQPTGWDQRRARPPADKAEEPLPFFSEENAPGTRRFTSADFDSVDYNRDLARQMRKGEEREKERKRDLALLTVQSLAGFAVAAVLGTGALYAAFGANFVHLGPKPQLLESGRVRYLGNGRTTADGVDVLRREREDKDAFLSEDFPKPTSDRPKNPDTGVYF